MNTAPTPRIGAKPRRWRPLFVLLGVGVCWKVFVLTVGGVLPSLLLNDGVAAVPPDLQPYGAQARGIARSLWNGRIERIGIRHIRVLHVERRVNDDNAARCGGMVAQVRAYTYFAIPYSDVRTVCDSGVVQYRWIRRLGNHH